MQPEARLFLFIALALALVAGTVARPALADGSDPLFVNLTTDDPHRANMGITFAKNQFERGHPLTVFLNDRAVYIGSSKNASRFSEHQSALADLVSSGATVLICPMCMKHYGVGEADLIPGLKVGSPDVTGAALFKDDTITLTW